MIIILVIKSAFRKLLKENNIISFYNFYEYSLCEFQIWYRLEGVMVSSSKLIWSAFSVEIRMCEWIAVILFYYYHCYYYSYLWFPSNNVFFFFYTCAICNIMQILFISSFSILVIFERFQNQVIRHRREVFQILVCNSATRSASSFSVGSCVDSENWNFRGHPLSFCHRVKINAEKNFDYNFILD